MNLKYRNKHGAEATARYWGKVLDKKDWYKVEALSDDEAEVLIYDVIGWPFNDAGDLVRSLAEMKQKTITVRINSPGGDVFDAMAIFNALQSHKSKVVTRIESLAASAASVIALAGKEVQAYKNAMVMIHEPWIYTAGNQYDLREMADILEKISGNMIDIYSGNSGIGKKEAKQMMKDETWLTAKEAKEKGFVDTIIDGKAAKAQFDLSMYANAPDGITGNKEGRDLDEREIELALRDAGASRSFAKMIVAERYKPLRDAGEAIAELEALKKKITGGN
jgi:ATP-dependent Clp protease, protease subunit